MDRKRTHIIEIGDGAAMTFPTLGTDSHYGLEHQLRYGVCGDMDTMAAASCIASYKYLVMNCNKEEAWRRIKAIRAAVQ